MNNQQEKTVLSHAEKLQLKKLAHHLKPVVQMGKHGVSEALIAELASALLAHELIKLQIKPEHKATLAKDIAAIEEQAQCCHVDTIGHMVILFRKNKEHSQFEF